LFIYNADFYFVNNYKTKVFQRPVAKLYKAEQFKLLQQKLVYRGDVIQVGRWGKASE
jgi:hypothetical protein